MPPHSRVRRADGLALAALVACAAAYAGAVVWRRAQHSEGLPNFDAYAWAYPNLLYLLDSLGRGHGLFWNTFQNCGQPFLANQQVALFYPFNALWLLHRIDAVMIALYGIHLVVAGAGMYWLGRVLGLRPAAALCGALLFQLSAITLWLGYWYYVILAVYAWIPAALAATERVLKGPSLGYVAALALILAMQLLAGHAQILVFAYQLILLRLVWEMLVRRRLLPLHAVAISAALALTPLLGAVQLFPAIEFVGHSLRGQPLTAAEIRPPALAFTWAGFRHSVGAHQGYGAVATAAGLVLAALAAGDSRRRSTALFYGGVALMYGVLAFDNPIFDLYRRLPLGNAFREPERFLWVTGFAASVLAAIGAEALLDRQTVAPRRFAWLLLPLAAGVALWWVALPGPSALAIGFASGMGLLVLLAVFDAPRSVIAPVLLLLVVGELWVGARSNLFGFLGDGAALFDERPEHRILRERMSDQDRVYQVPSNQGVRAAPGLGVIEKSAQVFRLRSIADHEPLAPARYARLMVRMLYGRPMASLNQFYFELRDVPASRPLFNLLAARFVVSDANAAPRVVRWLTTPGFRLLWEDEGARVYENELALPRASFVPVARLLTGDAEQLERLADPQHDPRAVVLVEDAQLDGVGDPSATGSASIVADTGERVAVQVHASGNGFLVLTDQHYPGWSATVNGAAAPIVRANYVFRAVAVPAGDSLVEFRYRERYFALGAATSAISLLALATGLAWSARRRRIAARATPGSAGAAARAHR